MPIREAVYKLEIISSYVLLQETLLYQKLV